MCVCFFPFTTRTRPRSIPHYSSFSLLCLSLSLVPQFLIATLNYHPILVYVIPPVILLSIIIILAHSLYIYTLYTYVHINHIRQPQIWQAFFFRSRVRREKTRGRIVCAHVQKPRVYGVIYIGCWSEIKKKKKERRRGLIY